MRLIERLKDTWIDKDKDKMSLVVKELYKEIESLDNTNSIEIPELYLFNSTFPLMIKILEEAYEEQDYYKVKYILKMFIKNYSLDEIVT